MTMPAPVPQSPSEKMEPAVAVVPRALVALRAHPQIVWAVALSVVGELCSTALTIGIPA
ncbi:hypothetical protein [Streptomyces sp. NPDC059928]|uniref:hypothetical protein n=1 Tax=unclassified Streptomyces TaxID=2593676 RepID=UPI0036667B4C